MVEVGGDLRLAEEAFDELMLGVITPENLERRLASERLIPNSLDHAHSAATNLFEQLPI